MSEFVVRSAVRRYTVSFSNRFEDALADRLEPGDVVIIDARVADIYEHRLGALGQDPRHLRLHADENAKSYLGVGPVIEHLTSHGFQKRNKLIAIGGGVIQDATAFTASILYRGVDWVFFPTTLLAQCDSCIGSKTSINFGRLKNQLGNFYPPTDIHIDCSLLESLPVAEKLSGIGEMAHYFLVASEKDFARFAAEAEHALSERDVLEGLIRRCLEIKRGFVEADEFDRGPRQVLNYGHSFGHALETLTNYELPHGIAVSYGMDVANFVSAKMGLIADDLRSHIRAVLEPLWRDHPVTNVSIPKYLEALRRDKKNDGATLGLILTRGIGEMFKRQVEVTPAFEGWLREYFDRESAR